MPVWCPKCNAMLNEGLEKCPRCGARLPAGGISPENQTSGESPLKRSETLWITGYLLAFLLIPVVLVLVIGLICIVVLNTGG